MDSYEEAELALRFTLSRDVIAALPPGHEELLWWACEAAEKLTPITHAEEKILKKKAAGL